MDLETLLVLERMPVNVDLVGTASSLDSDPHFVTSVWFLNIS